MQFDQLAFIPNKIRPPRERINVREQYILFHFACPSSCFYLVFVSFSLFSLPPPLFRGVFRANSTTNSVRKTRSKQEITNRCVNVANSIGQKVSVELGHASKRATRQTEIIPSGNVFPLCESVLVDRLSR